MKIQIIGADSAFDGLNTSFFFRDNLGRGILVDCGFTVFPELNRRGMLGDVDIVLVSHPHGDHTGSLTKLAAYQHFVFGKKLISGGHEWLPDLFRIQGILPEHYNSLPADDPLNLKIIPNKHIAAHGHNNALFIADTIFYSGDTNENLLDTDYARDSKIIFHEVALNSPAAHVRLADLATAAPEVKTKTWLIHIPTHERAEIERLAAEYGFAGVCYNGQEIEV